MIGRFIKVFLALKLVLYHFKTQTVEPNSILWGVFGRSRKPFCKKVSLRVPSRVRLQSRGIKIYGEIDLGLTVFTEVGEEL